jgi:phenylacetate-CoA ligase
MTPIITDLWHRTLPVIRYRLGDVVRLGSGECPCGSAFQVLDRVEGRSDDVCEFAVDDGSVRRVFPATIRRMVLLASDAVADYEAEQWRRSHLRVRVAIRPGADAARTLASVRARLLEGLREQGITRAHVYVQAGECRPPAGKRRRVRCVRSPSSVTEA